MKRIGLLLMIILTTFLAGCVWREGDAERDWAGLIIRADARTLAYRSFEVTSEWQEITFLTPLNTHAGLLHFDIKSWKEWTVKTGEKDETAYFNPQGERVIIEVIAIDQFGKEFNLLPYGFSSGFTFKQNQNPKFGETFDYDDYDKQRFVKMRVRSSQPFKCERIVWERYAL